LCWICLKRGQLGSCVRHVSGDLFQRETKNQSDKLIFRSESGDVRREIVLVKEEGEGRGEGRKNVNRKVKKRKISKERFGIQIQVCLPGCLVTNVD